MENIQILGYDLPCQSKCCDGCCKRGKKLKDQCKLKTTDVLLLDYHNYTELIAELEQLADSYPTTSQLYIQGSTVEGRQLAVIRISDKVQQVATSRKNNVLWTALHLSLCGQLLFLNLNAIFSLS